MKVALGSPPFPKSLHNGLYWLEKLVKEAVKGQAEIICFPESFLPGYPGMGYPEKDRLQKSLKSALDKVCRIASENAITIIIPMDWHHPEGLLNLAYVISGEGEILGYQTKNQLDPPEDNTWIAGTERSIFEVNGVKFGITICHEGFRYPESVRWAAQNDAKIVFHPHFAGSNTDDSIQINEWGGKNNPYYEKAMMMRSIENGIYFASSNYASLYPESASSIIAPDGTCIAHERYGRIGVIVADINPAIATGIYAKRFNNSLYA